MRLRVLGSGTCELRPERSSPAYLVRAGGTRLMLDLGQGAWRRLMEAGEDPADLSAVLISHHHPDHIADLPAFLFALNYDPSLSRRARVVLAGHSGLARVLDGLAGVFGRWVRPPEPRLTIAWLEGGEPLPLGEAVVWAAPAAHMETSLAYRIEHQGGSLVYLGDSEATDGLAAFAGETGLLVAHAAGPDEAPKTGHLTPSAAGRLAAEARAGALLLSHLYSDVDPERAVASARRFFTGPVWAARDHLEIEVGPAGARPVEALQC